MTPEEAKKIVNEIRYNEMQASNREGRACDSEYHYDRDWQYERAREHTEYAKALRARLREAGYDPGTGYKLA
jgi:hypothetical protein